MTTPLTTFPGDRSQRWILVPGVASTRQVEIRNDTDEAIEAHLAIEEPVTASVSPTALTIPGRHARIADIIFLATWSPQFDHRVRLLLRDAHGGQLGEFTQDIVAADSSDCNLTIDLKEKFQADGPVVVLKLWCTLTSRASTPRRFEVNFTPHSALRFPDGKNLTLSPGESSAFEVPVQWNRTTRDVNGWNHPRVIEAYVPVSDGRRSAIVLWERIETLLAAVLTPEDREARVAAAPEQRRTSFVLKSPGQLKYEELVELKRLEQGVVTATPARTTVKPAAEPATAPPPRARVAWAPLVTIGLALVALVLAGLFFLRLPARQVTDGPITVAPLKLSPTPRPQTFALRDVKAAATRLPSVVAEWTSVAEATRQHDTVTTAVPAAPRVVAAVPRAVPLPRPTIDRTQVVALFGVAAAYAAGGHAVSVAWNGSAQASALVQLVDFTGKVIASRTIRGGGNATTMRVPRGYHGPLSVNVTAFGYHGERVAQSASL
jgi:hypothetical protein